MHTQSTADILEYFLDTPLNYRSADSETNIVSTVDRLPSGNGLPTRFSKRIDADKKYTYLIGYENQFLEMVAVRAGKAKVVRQLDFRNRSLEEDKRYIEIITESVGVDADKWSLLPVRLQHNSRQYKSVFSHPSVFLRFIQGALVALQSIHRYGIRHCDFKADQICIPFVRELSADQTTYTLTPDFADISIIDFGTALWEEYPVARSNNPLPFGFPNGEAGYHGGGIMQAAYNQSEYKAKHGYYNFDKALQDVNYGMDLYAFGYMLQYLLDDEIEGVERHPAETKIWDLFYTDLQQWINELLKFEFGFFAPYSHNHLPHDTYISQIEQWIDMVDNALGYPSVQLSFVVENKQVIRDIKVTETPLTGASTINLTLNNKSIPIPWECTIPMESPAYDDTAFPNINTEVWTSSPVAKQDMRYFTTQDAGYWAVNLSDGSLSKKTANTKQTALLVLDTKN